MLRCSAKAPRKLCGEVPRPAFSDVPILNIIDRKTVSTQHGPALYQLIAGEPLFCVDVNTKV